MANRQWYVNKALLSASDLVATLPELTEEEVMECLELESQTRRRRSILNRLVSRAVRLNELAYVAGLKEKYLK